MLHSVQRPEEPSEFMYPWLYRKPVPGFLEDARKENGAFLTDKIARAWAHIREYNKGEWYALRSSIQEFARLLNRANLSDKQTIILEALVPTERGDIKERIDAILCGKDVANNDSIVVLEAKGWDPKYDVNLQSNPNDTASMLYESPLGKIETILHPSHQVLRYTRAIEAGCVQFLGKARSLLVHPFVYLYRQMELEIPEWDAVMRHPRVGLALDKAPIYTRYDSLRLSEIIHENIGHGKARNAMDKLQHVLKQTEWPQNKNPPAQPEKRVEKKSPPESQSIPVSHGHKEPFNANDAWYTVDVAETWGDIGISDIQKQ